MAIGHICLQLAYLSGCVLNGSGLKDIEAFQTCLGNGLQLLPSVGLKHHSSAPHILTFCHLDLPSFVSFVLALWKACLEQTLAYEAGWSHLTMLHCQRCKLP